MIVAGGFGSRGIEGKIAAAQYARTHKIPYLGLCLGLQIAVIGSIALTPSYVKLYHSLLSRIISRSCQ